MAENSLSVSLKIREKKYSLGELRHQVNQLNENARDKSFKLICKLEKLEYAVIRVFQCQRTRLLTFERQSWSNLKSLILLKFLTNMFDCQLGDVDVVGSWEQIKNSIGNIFCFNCWHWWEWRWWSCCEAADLENVCFRHSWREALRQKRD